MMRNVFWVPSDGRQGFVGVIPNNYYSPILALIFLLQRHTMTKAELKKESVNWGLIYSFRGLVHNHHDGMQIDILMEQ